MRLNIVTGSPIPPFARMTLNQTLANAQRIPKTLNVTAAKQEYRCEHVLSTSVTQADRSDVEQTLSALTLYREVALKDFPTQ